MIGLLFSPAGKAVGAILLGAALLAGTWLHGRQAGREAGRIEILEDTLDAYQDREDIDQKIGDLDRHGLCLELGGLPDECERLRGLAARRP